MVLQEQERLCWRKLLQQWERPLSSMYQHQVLLQNGEGNLKNWFEYFLKWRDFMGQALFSLMRLIQSLQDEEKDLSMKVRRK